MQFLKNFAEKKGKKGIQNVVIMLLAGIALLLLSSYFSNLRGDGADRDERDWQHQVETEARETTQAESQGMAAYIARQMEDILSLVAGAGQVRVMLTLGGTSTIYAQNIQASISNTTEDDGEGGTRSIDTESLSNSFVALRGANGEERPLRLEEIAPTVQGVIIVAQGAGDVAVRDALTRGAHTLLGIGAHQVQVFQMDTR